MSLPNLITIARILLVPLIVLLILSQRMTFAFALFVVAGLSDGVDGFIAKRYNQITELGAYLDPIADKLLLVSIYVTLGWLHQLPEWLVILVVARDLLIVGAFLLSWVMGVNIKIAPLMVSKINTTVQIILAGFVLANLGFGLNLSGIIELSIYVVATFTILSGVAYLIEWMNDMARYEDGRDS